MPLEVWTKLSQQNAPLAAVAFGVVIVHGALLARQMFGCRGVSQKMPLTQAQLTQALELLRDPTVTGGEELNAQSVAKVLLEVRVCGRMFSADRFEIGRGSLLSLQIDCLWCPCRVCTEIRALRSRTERTSSVFCSTFCQTLWEIKVDPSSSVKQKFHSLRQMSVRLVLQLKQV